MSRLTEQTAQKDEAYYWPDNVTFLVEGVLFRVPRFQFITGSKYFAQKYGLCSDDKGAKEAVHLEGVSAADFRVFLGFLFPIPSNTPLPSIFEKEEWLMILTLCTKWHFPEFRALAIKNLDGKLTELELIHVRRTLCVQRFVVEGYQAIVERPKDEIITENEATVIGHEATNKLWIIRYQLHISSGIIGREVVVRELRLRFADELAELGRREREGWNDDNVHEESAAKHERAIARGMAVADAYEDDQKDVPAHSWGDEFEATAIEPSGKCTGREISNGSDRWGVDRDATRRAQLEHTLEVLKEEEREISEQLRQVRSRKSTPEAAEKLEAVRKEMQERIEGELRSIQETKLAEEEAKKQLAEHEASRTSPHQTFPEAARVREGLLSQLDDLRRRRAELEQEHTNNENKESGQIIRWIKVGKRHNLKAVEKWSTELTRCQNQREEVEEQLLTLLGLGRRKDSNVVNGNRTEEGDGPGVSTTQVGTAPVDLDEEGGLAAAEEKQMSEQQREFGEAMARLRQQKQTQLQREASLRAQKADFSKKLENVERLMRQGGVLLPKTIEKRERKQKKCQSRLLAIEAGLKEVNQLLEVMCVEEEKLEYENRWL